MMDNSNDPSMLQGLDFGGGFPGAFPPQVGFNGNPLTASGNESITMLDEFSTEDNTLLMSVLNSTPIEQQYSFYVPPAGGQVAVPPPWPDLAAPNVASYGGETTGMTDYSAPYGAFGMGSHGFPALSGQQGRGQNPAGLPTKPQGNSFSSLPPNIPIKQDPTLSTSSMQFPPMPFPPQSMQPSHHGRQQAANPIGTGSSSLSSGYPTIANPQVVVTSPTEISHESAATSVSAERDESHSDGDGDEHDSNSNQRNKRRESQNRASRNYRQRKKQYIKEIEAKLEALRLENDQLRVENQRNRRLMTQFQAVLDKPAPLLRSFSSELMTEDQEIEKIVLQLSEAAQRKMDDNTLRSLLDMFHQHSARRQGILHKEAMQLVNPKMQERLVRLEGVPPQQVESQLGKWLQYVSQFVSQEQVGSLTELKRAHLAQREQIYNERMAINHDIKEFYQEKLAGERLNAPGKLEQAAVLTLTSKLEQLKKNLARESELNNATVQEFSKIFTPYQEAIITIKHYSFYKDKLSAIHMLNNVWSVLSQKQQ